MIGKSHRQSYLEWVAKAEALLRHKQSLESELLRRHAGISVSDVRNADGDWKAAVANATMYGIGALLEVQRGDGGR